MPIKTAIPTAAMREFLLGTHQPTDTYKIALFTGKADLGATTEVYGPSGEVKGDGYKAGGMELKGHGLTIDKGTVILGFETPIWARATITARGCMIYNASKESKVLGVFDFGGEVSCTNGPFVATMPESTASKGLIRIE